MNPFPGQNDRQIKTPTPKPLAALRPAAKPPDDGKPKPTPNHVTK